LKATPERRRDSVHDGEAKAVAAAFDLVVAARSVDAPKPRKR
jgi:hypothetical protein